MNFKIQTIQSFLLMLSILFVSWSVEAKQIKKDAVDYAENYFSLGLAKNLFGGADIPTALGKTSRNDFKFIGEGEKNGVKQSGYLSNQPDFLMVTISKQSNSNNILSVNITKIDTDIPVSKIKYLAFDSRTDGKGKNKVKTLYMGDGSINGIPIRHLLQETSQYTRGDYKQITWMYAVNYK
jgi:hypothetical protein